MSKESTRWQGLGLKPPTFSSEVQRANRYTTAPPRPRALAGLSSNAVSVPKFCETFGIWMYFFIVLYFDVFFFLTVNLMLKYLTISCCQGHLSRFVDEFIPPKSAGCLLDFHLITRRLQGERHFDRF